MRPKQWRGNRNRFAFQNQITGIQTAGLCIDEKSREASLPFEGIFQLDKLTMCSKVGNYSASRNWRRQPTAAFRVNHRY